VSEPTVDSQVISLQASGADVLLIAASPKFAAQAIRKSYDLGWSATRYVTDVSLSIATVMKAAGFEKARGLITANYGKDASDPRWKDADSSIFLNLAIEEIQNAGYRIVNVDTTLVLTAPKIGPIAAELRERVADLLDVEPSDVGIKAKTPEGLNADHVAQAHAIVLLEKIEDPEELRSMSAVVESQKQLEDVVKDLVSQVHGVEPRRVLKPAFDTEDIT